MPIVFSPDWDYSFRMLPFILEHIKLSILFSTWWNIASKQATTETFEMVNVSKYLALT